MIRRPRRTVPAVIVGAVLLAACVVLAVSCIQVVTGRAPLVSFTAVGQFAANTAVNDPATVAGGVLVALIGLLLLACAVLPGTPQVIALAPSNDHTDAGVNRRSLARDLTSYARRADGITDAHVTVGARTVKVNACTPLRDRSGLSERVRELVAGRLEDVNLARPARVRVTITPDRSAR
jgi:Family of unknown function (DUF6286)